MAINKKDGNYCSCRVYANANNNSAKLLVKCELSSNCHLTLPPSVKYPEHDNREWLYDAILYKATVEGIDEIILCVESEWSRNEDELFWDFSKLLIVRSKIHLMIFDAPKGKYKEYIEKMKAYIDNSKICKGHDEIYIFAYYPEENNEQLKFEEYVVA